MISCSELSDRMPEVAAGRAVWSAPEGGHLAECSDCQAEWRLVQAAAELGVAVGRTVAPDQIAAGVRNRLQAPPTPATSWPGRVRRVALPLAAAAVLLLLVWQASPWPRTDPEPVTLMAVLPELDGLSEAELETMFTMVTGAEADPAPPLGTSESLGDLSDEELESLLRLLEG